MPSALSKQRDSWERLLSLEPPQKMMTMMWKRMDSSERRETSVGKQCLWQLWSLAPVPERLRRDSSEQLRSLVEIQKAQASWRPLLELPSELMQRMELVP